MKTIAAISVATALILILLTSAIAMAQDTDTFQIDSKASIPLTVTLGLPGSANGPVTTTVRIAIDLQSMSLISGTEIVSYSVIVTSSFPSTDVLADVSLAEPVSVTARLRVVPSVQPTQTESAVPSRKTITGTVKSNANLRAGPGTDHAVAGKAIAGQELTIVAENLDGSWYQLANGAWIAAFLVDVVDNGERVEDPGPEGDSSAIVELTQRIELNPQDALAYLDRGLAYQELGEYEEALRDYASAIEVDPDLASAYAHRGSALTNLGEHEQAIEDYDRAIGLDPNVAWYHSNRGASYYLLKDFEQAIEDYGTAIELEPESAGYRANRGAVYATMEQDELALADLNEAIELDPVFAMSYHIRGSVSFRTGEYEQALSDLEKHLELAPDSPYRERAMDLINESKSQLRE